MFYQVVYSLQYLERCETLLDNMMKYLFEENVLMLLLFVLNRQVLAA